MSQSKSISKFSINLITLLSLINCVIIGIYFIVEQSIPFSGKWILGSIATLLMFLLIAAAMKWTQNFIVSLNVILLFTLLTIVVLEIFFSFFPSITPSSIRNLVSSPNDSLHKSQVVERLPYSPYAKLRPNTLIHVPGYYGPSESFEYEWITDASGYKNTKKISTIPPPPVIAVGDSFTEGFGVKVNETWAARLTDLGVPTYSLGVQGYAPSQFYGTLLRYGIALKPKWVIVGYLGGDYLREEYFFKLASHSSVPSELPSAIGRLVNFDSDIGEDGARIFIKKNGFEVPVLIKTRHTFIFSALVNFIYQTIQIKLHHNIEQGVADLDKDARFSKSESALMHGKPIRLPLMARYVGEFESLEASQISSGDLLASRSWVSTEKALGEIVQLSRNNGIKVLFVFFPGRSTSYYQAATGSPLPSLASDLVEAKELKNLAQKLDVPYIDMTPVFQDYVLKLHKDSGYVDFPYLIFDGHPSPLGHEIIANEIKYFFSSKGFK